MRSNTLKISLVTFFWFLLKNPAPTRGIFTILSPNKFTEFILEQSDLFVDKSLLIQEFLENESKLISILRPKLWGKTLNLDMVQTFLELEVDQDGNIVPDENKVNRKCFIGGEHNSSDGEIKKLKPLKIANISSAMEHQGKHPVIRIDLENVQYCIYNEMECFFKDMVSKLFDSYPYLKKYYESEDEDVISDLQKDQLRRYYMKNGTQFYLRKVENMTIEDVSDSIRFLSELLYKHFNRTVYIFVSDYNAPFILHSVFPDNSLDEYRNITVLLKELFCKAFNNNPYLEKGFFTDQIPLIDPHLELMSHLNDLTVYTLLDDKFSEFYGFTQPEIDELLSQSKSIVDRREIENFYKGYNHGRQIVYNPTSVIHHIMYEGKYDPCWLQVADLPGNVDKLIAKNTRWQEIMTDLYKGFSVNSTIESTICCYKCTQPTCVYSLLVYSGFLNPICRYPNNTYELIVPNDELKEFYSKMIRDRVKKKLFVDIEVNTNFMEFLPIDLIDGFKDGYKNYILTIEKFLQLKPSEQESCHNDLMLMLIDRLSSRYKTAFRKFPSTGETVAVLVPKVKYVDNAIFIGYKAAKNLANLTSEAKICLERVKSLKGDVVYANSTNARNILEIGVTFCVSHTAVEYDVKLLK